MSTHTFINIHAVYTHAYNLQHTTMDGWNWKINVWNEIMNGWIYKWMDGWMGVNENEWMDETEKGIDGWIEKWMNENWQMDGWMNGIEKWMMWWTDRWNWQIGWVDGLIDWKMYDVIYVWWMDGIETGWMDEGVELPERWFDQWDGSLTDYSR